MIINGNKLIADEGMTLTNGDAFGKTVWLASGDDGSTWQEITDAEAEALKREKMENEKISLLFDLYGIEHNT